MNALRAILFDKDGTLVDFDRTWGPAAGAVMERLAQRDAAALAQLHAVSHYLPAQRRFLQTSPLIAGSSRQYGPLWAEVLGRPADPDFFQEMDRLFTEEGRRFLTPIGSPASTIARLHRTGLPLGIATNDAEANARLQIELLGIGGFMSAVYGYDSGHGPKPAPGMVEAFCELTGVPPHEVALVGDTRHDLDTARAAGARAILVRCGPGPVDDFAGEADLVVDDVEALVDLIFSDAREMAS
ncbi:HAD family hydrolase [Ancylobacter pratisalsi]|uniref:phosphoglycolate phosphatase n=1 Tax=Ancylobacter pratisalsi TaxID=1745854 RepID=A0A6P1YNG0_9HYPH|nr:HAD family hydrolase [Ancylobacter pratisalsi]QIB33753.1 HAD family hydrolase [Ancylobacter pratisalsi]